MIKLVTPLGKERRIFVMLPFKVRSFLSMLLVFLPSSKNKKIILYKRPSPLNDDSRQMQRQKKEAGRETDLANEQTNAWNDIVQCRRRGGGRLNSFLPPPLSYCAERDRQEC